MWAHHPSPVAGRQPPLCSVAGVSDLRIKRWAQSSVQVWKSIKWAIKIACVSYKFMTSFNDFSFLLTRSDFREGKDSKRSTDHFLVTAGNLLHSEQAYKFSRFWFLFHGSGICCEKKYIRFGYPFQTDSKRRKRLVKPIATIRQGGGRSHFVGLLSELLYITYWETSPYLASWASIKSLPCTRTRRYGSQ